MKPLEEKEKAFRDKIKIDIKKLANDFGCSREGVYSYIKHFVKKEFYAIPIDIRKFLEAINSGKCELEWQQYQILHQIVSNKK